MPIGLSKSLVRARSRLVAVPRRSPCGLSRSVQASPTPPNRRQIVRNARSQYPAIGASRRLVASRTGPMVSGAPITGKGSAALLDNADETAQGLDARPDAVGRVGAVVVQDQERRVVVGRRAAPVRVDGPEHGGADAGRFRDVETLDDLHEPRLA